MPYPLGYEGDKALAAYPEAEAGLRRSVDQAGSAPASWMFVVRDLISSFTTWG